MTAKTATIALDGEVSVSPPNRGSAIAAQSLVDLGYRNIDNLDGGMTAWTAGGGELIHVAH